MCPSFGEQLPRKVLGPTSLKAFAGAEGRPQCAQDSEQRGQSHVNRIPQGTPLLSPAPTLLFRGLVFNLTLSPDLTSRILTGVGVVVFGDVRPFEFFAGSHWFRP